MARRKSSLLDEMLNWPWWVSVLMGAFTSIVIAVTGSMIPTNRDVGVLVASICRSSWAYPLLLCSFVGLLAAIRRGIGKSFLRRSSDVAAARALEPLQFERLIAAYYRKEGWQTRENVSLTPDGGVDVWMSRGGRRALVQCKRWSPSRQVGVEKVREFFGVMTLEKADEGMLITTSSFTAEAREFGGRVEHLALIDGARLDRMLKEASGLPPEPTPAAAVADAREFCESVPTCPECLSPMVRRTAGKGAFKGQPFWGCSRYSAGCRGKRSPAGPALAANR